MVRLGEVSLWMWIMGLTVAGVVVFTTGMHMNENQMNSIGRQIATTEFSELLAKARLACDAGQGTTYPYVINLADDVKAIYSADSDSEPPDKVSVLITRREMNIGNFLCIRYNNDDEPYCEKMDCDINMTYLGQASMEDSLAGKVKDEMGIESNAFEIVIRKTDKNTVYIGAEEIIPIERQPILCGNGELDSDEQCDMNARSCEPLYGECSKSKCVKCKCETVLECGKCEDGRTVQGSDWMKYCNEEDTPGDDEDQDMQDDEEEVIEWEGDVIYVSGDDRGDYICEGDTCNDEINEALEFVAENEGYTTVHLLGPYTFWIDDTIYMGGETILEGDSDAIIKLVANAGWPTDKAFIEAMDEKQEKMVIRGFEIDGNCYEQDGIIIGKGYYTMIALSKPYEVSVYNMYLHDGLSDGIRIYHDYTTEYMTVPTNIKIHDNTIFEIGHDAVWLKHSSSADIYDNDITIKADAAVRLTECMDINIHDNLISSNNKGFAGIEIDKKMSSTKIDNIEIYDNVIHDTRAWGIWLMGYTKDGSTYDADMAKGVHIYHNQIYGTGTDAAYQQAGAIVIQGFDKTIIENNVIDDNTKYGIAHELYDFAHQAEHSYGPPPEGETFTTIVRNNIITNTKRAHYMEADRRGYGIANLIENHNFVLQNNIVWNSETANYEGVSPGADDMQVDPQFADADDADYHLMSTFGRWNDGQWVQDSVMSPGIDAGYSGSSYSNEPEDNGDRINIGVYGNTKEASLSGPLAEDEEEEDVLENYEADIVIDDDPNPPVENARFYLTSDYANDAACIQAALDDAENGDTIVIREGDYYITSRLYQKGKSLNIIGDGDVTLELHTPDGLKNGVYLTGSFVKTTNLAASAQKGSSTVVLSDASQIQKNDLISIWKNVLWCPQDYAEQKTGEMYSVQSVSGNVVTLNEPLIRDYPLSDSPQTEISRPIEVHIKNIGLQDSSATGDRMALTLETCRDSSISDVWVRDSGLAAITLYGCFNVDVSDCEVHNSVKPGSGYGVGAWSGSAFIDIHDNYIENCRHTITGNTNERVTLIRDITITNNELIGGTIVGANVIDAHAITINYKVTNNKITVQSDFYAFIDGTLDSEFSGNEIYGGRGAVVNRGNIDGGTHIIKDNYIEGSNSYVYRAYGSGDKDTFIIENNVQKGGSYGVYMSSDQPVTAKNIIIRGNTFSGVSYQAIYQKFLINGVNLEISGNTFENIGREGVYIDGTSYTNGDVEITNNIFTNVYPSSPSNVIRTINIQNPVISGNQID